MIHNAFVTYPSPAFGRKLDSYDSVLISGKFITALDALSE